MIEYIILNPWDYLYKSAQQQIWVKIAIYWVGTMFQKVKKLTLLIKDEWCMQQNVRNEKYPIVPNLCSMFQYVDKAQNL